VQGVKYTQWICIEYSYSPPIFKFLLEIKRLQGLNNAFPFRHIAGERYQRAKEIRPYGDFKDELLSGLGLLHSQGD